MRGRTGGQQSLEGLALDIQGLRAVAVGLVLLFHVWPATAPGGFVGVDLFFVVSGYLIFGILLRAADRDGSIVFLPFVAARVRRIVPAVAAVLIVIGLASPLFPPTEWRPVAEELPPSAFFYENWVLAAHAIDYWARDDNPSILQHFWSLGVEFQFYLGAPVVLAGLVWLSPRTGISFVRLAITTLLALTVLSFVLAVVATDADPRRAYFATETRMWEFGLGGLVAALGLRRRLSARSRRADLAGLLGIAMILAAAVALRSEALSPGWALAGCLGAAALIASGGGSVWGRAMSARPIIWIGGISYGIYLWHWPIMVLWPGNIADGYGPAAGSLIITLSIAFAAATKWLLEDPIRYSEALRRHPGRSLVGGIILAATAAAMALIPERLATGLEAEAESIADLGLYPGALALTEGVGVPAVDPLPALTWVERDWPEPYLAGCQAGPGPDALLTTCEYGAVDGDVHLVVVGDSHATQFAAPIIEAAARNEWQYTHMTMSACAFTDEPVLRDGYPYPECSEWNRAAVAQLARLAPDFVVVTQSRSYALPGLDRAASVVAMRDALLRRWRELLDMGIGIIAIRDTPRMWMSSADCIVTADVRCSAPRAAVLTVDDPIVMAASLEPRVALIDLTDAICGPTTCEPVVGNVLVWMDPSHLSNAYARTMTNYVEEALVATIQRGQR